MEDKASILPPCKVCGGKATGLHFGAITCEACKAFYKRTRGRLKPYKCRGNDRGTCTVRFDIIPMCSHCRHLKIIELGMSEEGVHRGRCPLDRKTQLVIEAKEIEHKNQGPGSKWPSTGSKKDNTSVDSSRGGVKRAFQKPNKTPVPDSCEDDSSPECNAKLSYKPGDRFLELDLFLTEDFDDAAIAEMAETISRADADHQVYDTCETSIAESRNRKYAEAQIAKEALLGPLRPLTHEEYTEIYESTGIDLDDYRAKARIMEYMKNDINTYIDFVKNLPGYKELNLHDRITVAKGGFAGWLVLSVIHVYSKELNSVGMVYDILWSSSDFVRYIGKEFSDGMRQCLTVLLKNNATDEEVALLKALHVYTVRSEYGVIHNKTALEKRHQILRQALENVAKKTRSLDEVTWAFKEMVQTLEPLNQVAKSFRHGVSQWPLKFPQYSCPRILQEIVGQQCEEELLVAVSMQLRSTHL